MPVNKVILGDETLIDISNDSVDEENLVEGYTAHDKHGKLITGKLTPTADTVDGGHFNVTDDDSELPSNNTISLVYTGG